MLSKENKKTTAVEPKWQKMDIHLPTPINMILSKFAIWNGFLDLFLKFEF